MVEASFPVVGEGGVKASGGTSEEIEVSVVLDRYIEVEREVPIYPEFPW